MCDLTLLLTVSSAQVYNKKFLNIILIDDDPILRYSLKKMVSAYLGNDIFISFASGYEAISYFEGICLEEAPKIVILLDLNMPIVTGRDFLKLFAEKMIQKEHKFSIHIISSSCDPKEREELLAHTLVDGFINKPVTMKELKDLLNKELTNFSKSDPSSTKHA